MRKDDEKSGGNIVRVQMIQELLGNDKKSIFNSE